MISLAPGTKVFLACQPIDLRAGFNGLAAKVQQVIGQSPFDSSLFIFRGKRGAYFKAIYWDGSGLWLLAKRLETGRFVWPPIVDGDDTDARAVGCADRGDGLAPHSSATCPDSTSAGLTKHRFVFYCG